jgi:gluconolactonase
LILDLQGRIAVVSSRILLGVAFLLNVGLSGWAADVVSADEVFSDAIVSDDGPVKVASDCKFTEGPAVDAKGNLFFSDGPNDRIMRLSPDGELSVFRSPCGRTNGMEFDPEGRLVMCQSSGEGGKRRVARLERDGSETVLADQFDGLPFIGRIYFTDPNYLPPDQKPELPSGVYRIDPPESASGGNRASGAKRSVVRVIEGLLRPNGIVLTADESTLYVSDRGTQKLLRYLVAADGSLSPDGTVYDFSPDRGVDGMCLDAEGNIFAAAGEGATTGLFVVSPAGKLLAHRPMPEFSTNVAFGGRDGRDLFLTAGTSVYRLQSRTPGAMRFGTLAERE